MPNIGHVTRSESGGFTGELRTLSIRAPIEIVVTPSKRGEGQPHYRVMSDGAELGSGWSRRSEITEREYVSLDLAAPEFGPRRIYVTLAPHEGEGCFSLLWIPAD